MAGRLLRLVGSAWCITICLAKDGRFLQESADSKASTKPSWCKWVSWSNRCQDAMPDESTNSTAAPTATTSANGTALAPGDADPGIVASTTLSAPRDSAEIAPPSPPTTQAPAASQPQDESGSRDWCSCAGWCQKTARATWKWMPPCCGCATIPDGEGVKPPDTEEPPDTDESGDSAEGGADAASETSEDDKRRCTKCANWCQKVPAGSWKWNPMCCGCSEDPKEDTIAQEDEESVPGIPAWCRVVPVAQRKNMAACNPGSAATGDAGEVAESDHTAPKWCSTFKIHVGVCKPGTCKCANFCDSTPPNAQPNSPSCCGCKTALWDADDQDDSIPKWCKSIPARFRRDKCRPEPKVCQCQEWCSTESVNSQAVMPECCACPDAAAKYKDFQGEVEYPAGSDEDRTTSSGRGLDPLRYASYASIVFSLVAMHSTL